jgi:hypothetical protein
MTMKVPEGMARVALRLQGEDQMGVTVYVIGLHRAHPAPSQQS